MKRTVRVVGTVVFFEADIDVEIEINGDESDDRIKAIAIQDAGDDCEVNHWASRLTIFDEVKEGIARHRAAELEKLAAWNAGKPIKGY